MALITIKSKNPKFSYVLNKNPSSGMSVREVRLGKAAGWYAAPDVYAVYFKDADDEVSYPDYSKFGAVTGIDHLDKNRYTSPMFPINAIGEFFNHVLNKDMPDDIPAATEVTLYSQKVPERTLELLQKQFASIGYTVTATKINERYVDITFSKETTLKEMLALIYLTSMFLTVKSSLNYYFDEPIKEKLLRCVGIVDAPYFLRYMLKVYFLKDTGSFNKYKDLLAAGKNKIEFTFGDIGQARMKAIDEMVGTPNELVDFGCGEGRYVTHFASKVESIYAIDKDVSVVEDLKTKLEKRKIANVTVSQADVNQVAREYSIRSKGNRVALFTEVMEHMDLDLAKNSLVDMLKGFNTVVVTTPNADFNYLFHDPEGTLRHEDHKFELTFAEFEKMMKDLCPASKNVKIGYIGDIVNGIGMTSYAVFAENK